MQQVREIRQFNDSPITVPDERIANAVWVEPRIGALRRRPDRIAIDFAVRSEECSTGSLDASYGHFTTGGIDDRIASTLPPVFRPNTVPRS